MGCGRSRLQIFQSTSASKKKKKKKDQEVVVDNADAQSIEESVNDINGPESASARRAAAVARFRHISQGPLLAMAEVSRSQTDFFRMLDEKIENGPDYDFSDENKSLSPSKDSIKSRRVSLLSNGHKAPVNIVKFHSQGFITSSPTKCRTPQPAMSPKHRLPTLQASPPPRDPARRGSPTHILSLALASSPLKISQGSPRMFGSNKIFKSEELASRYD